MAETIFVVDASIVVPWFFTDEPRRAHALLAEDLGGLWLTADERAAKIAGRKFARLLEGWVRER